MKNFFESIGYKLRTFMRGRYGMDELSYFISVIGIIMLLLSILIPPLFILYFVGFVLLIWTWFRFFSRNIYKRQVERNKYLMIKGNVRQNFVLIKNKWVERKTHKYYKCPSCKATIRITKPARGRKIKINCPKCHNNFVKKT